MNRSAAAALLVAGLAVAAGMALAAACIPDLPSDQQPAPVTADNCGDGIINLSAGEQCDPGPGAALDGGIGGCSTSCQVECEGGLIWAKNNHCYQVISPGAAALESVSESASDLCLSASGHVVTFASNDEFFAVQGALGDGSPFWIGLTESASGSTSQAYQPVDPMLREPGWSAACPGCYMYMADAATPLPVYPEASVDGGSTDCIVAGGTLAQPWQQFPCRVPQGMRLTVPLPQVICEREPVGRLSSQCEAGSCFDLVATFGRKHYVYEQAQVPYGQAEPACENLGGHLVNLESSDEREQLWRELSVQNLPPSAVWIGLAEVPGKRSVWAWDDGTPDKGYSAEWGNSQPVSTVNGGTTLAFLWSRSSEDSTLAHNDQMFPTLAYVCEISEATDAGHD